MVGRKLGLDMGQASAAGEGDSAGHSIVGDPYATLDRWWREWRHWRDFRSVVRARVVMFAAGAEAEGDEARAARLRRFARTLVRRHRADIERVAAKLRDRGTVSGPDLDAMVPGPKPPTPDLAWLELISAEPEGEPVQLSRQRVVKA